MSNPQTLVRVLDELIWRLRRAGFDVSTAQAIDVARAAKAVGIADAVALRRAIAGIVVSRAGDRARFEGVVDEFFSPERASVAFWARLRQSGFHVHEIDILREALAALATAGHGALGALLQDAAALDRAVVTSGVGHRIDAEGAPRLGFEVHRLLRETGLDRSKSALELLRARLTQKLGVRGEALADAVAAELERLQEAVRHAVRDIHAERVHEQSERSSHGVAASKPFDRLSESDLEAVRRALRQLARRLAGRARVRARRASRGRVDVRRTLRASLSTGGVPFSLRRKERRHDRPRMVLLCDISDSVRPVARLLLEFTYAVQELFEDVRTFVFVSELGETTDLFSREPASSAVQRAWGGAGLVRTDENSNYGRVLRSFEARYLSQIDRRTLVLILGDGRTNYQNAGAEVLDSIREKARALYWLCPEPRGKWSLGDSAMLRYASKCSGAYEVVCAEDVERIALAMVSAHGAPPGALRTA
ncbi:MAG TPA: VWA domain-containing protein [Polyangiaceae bacterium]|nr:VWA domain-containing protein [Polyangiaceae bacterium]